MALQPDIALQGPKSDFVDTLGKFQAAGLARQQQINAAASLPTIQAEAANAPAQQEAATQSAQAKAQQDLFNAKKQADIKAIVASSIETDANGQPVLDTNGQPKINDHKAVAGITQAGYLQDAIDFGKGILSNQASTIKNADDRLEYQKKFNGFVSTVAQALPVHQREAFVNSALDFTNKTAPGQIDPDQVFTSDAGLKAMAKGTMTPKEQQELAINQQNADTSTGQLRYAQETGMDTPDAKDATSSLSTHARDLYFQHTGQKLPDTMSAFEMANNPQTKAQLDAMTSATMINSGTKGQAAQQNGVFKANNNDLKQLNTAIDNVKSKYKIGSIAGSALTTALQRYAVQDADVQYILNKTKQMQQINPEMDLTKNGLDGVQKIAGGMISNNNTNIDTNNKILNSASYKELESKPTEDKGSPTQSVKPGTRQRNPKTGQVRVMQENGQWQIQK
jgi:hypothetical protein